MGFFFFFFSPISCCKRRLSDLLVKLSHRSACSHVLLGISTTSCNNHPTVIDKKHNQRQHIREKMEGTPTQCAIAWLTFRCCCGASSTSFVVEGRLMRMLMQNLIKLQHALSAPNPNWVIYSKYVFFVLQFLWAVCFTSFKELAVKQVQFEHVNTGSFFFLAMEMTLTVRVKKIWK